MNQISLLLNPVIEFTTIFYFLILKFGILNFITQKVNPHIYGKRHGQVTEMKEFCQVSNNPLAKALK